MQRINVVLETNYAGKLEYKSFCHIAFLPKNGLKGLNCFNTPVTISTSDESYPKFNATLKDVLVYQFFELPEHLTKWSHNLTKDEFEQYLNLNYKTTIYQYMHIGVYCYTKD